MIKRNIKMMVTPKESKQVQEICFTNGIFWGNGDRSTMYTYKPFLYISTVITFGDKMESFKENSKEEVDAKFFIRTNVPCIEENQEFKVGDIVGVYCPHPLCGYTNVKVVGVEVDNYILEAGKDSTGHIPYQLRNKNFFVVKGKVFVTGYEQQFLLKQNIKENKMKDNEVETYKDVKEYLVAKGLYDRVMNIEWEELDEYESFSALYIWMDTKEGASYWSKVDKELRDLDIHMNIESLVQDYKAKQRKEVIQYLETQPKEVMEQTPKQPNETKPKQYMCFCPTKGKPKHIHQSLESAQEEAKRLCKSGLCEVMVLEVVSKYQAKVIVEEV